MNTIKKYSLYCLLATFVPNSLYLVVGITSSKEDDTAANNISYELHQE